MEKINQFQLSGTLSVCTDVRGGTYIQFLPDFPETINIKSLRFEGVAQLLSCGQLELVSNKSNK